MTFKSLISNSGTSQSSFLDPIYDSGYKDLKRGDYSHGWKSGSGNKGNSALNAITLLAFLFFLNILQSCLRDNLLASQGPIVVVVNTETETSSNTTRVTTRTKRSTEINEASSNTDDGILLNDATHISKGIEEKIKPVQ
ncbi:uncharacterized protein LOC120353607 [Nilaparvata lugens]|uniref:uncharacterized protein LOC120353607 n=1 Tax=Nilaparvata lugens TaxID=108931 RepID=UPI00193CC0AC|nr:uncharacterized protein LOC120353607 [Nilaparvata lugens]